MSKPSLSLSDQLARLDSRGLVGTQNEITRVLTDHGYFRLSGYWRYLQINPGSGENRFQPGTHISDVMSVYSLDADVRNILLEGLSQVETALKSMMALRLCVPGGPGLEYLDPITYADLYNDKGHSLRAKLLVDICNDIERSKDAHVAHHRESGLNSVPLWVATEALSFGVVSKMYGLLSDDSVGLNIASRFGYSSFAHFRSNLRSIVAIRNVCAHHGRIWNRTIRQDKPRIFPKLVEPGLFEVDYRDTPWGVIEVAADMVQKVRRDDTFRRQIVDTIDRKGPYWAGLVNPRDT